MKRACHNRLATEVNFSDGRNCERKLFTLKYKCFGKFRFNNQYTLVEKTDNVFIMQLF